MASSAFTGSLFPTLLNHVGPLQGAWGHWGALIRLQALYIYTIHGAIDGQFCFYRRSFSHPAKPHRSTTRCKGPLGGTNKATWCVRLLPMTVSAYHVDCGCFCALLGTHCCCLSPCGWYNPPSAPHPPPLPTPPAHPPTINSIRDITAVGKKLSQNPAVSAMW